MTKNRFLEFALDCGVGVAMILAQSSDVSMAQIELWLNSLPAYRTTHHY